MIDALVSSVIVRLGNCLIQEVVFQRGVKHEVESLKKDLEWMHSFVNDAQEKQVSDPMIRQWVSDILEIAYDSEDVLDKFMLEIHDEGASNMLKLDEEGTSKSRQRFFDFFKCSCIYGKGKELINLRGIGKEIKDLKGRLNDVSRRCKSFGLENVNATMKGESPDRGRLKELRRITSSQIVDINVVGHKDDTGKLLAQLLDEKKSQRLVISIFGTGGLGKTTLAGNLYHHESIKRKFHRRAWVSVSQNYRTHDLLQRIIKSFTKGDTSEWKMLSEDDLKKMSDEDLVRYLRQSLQGHPYLTVIDDIWDKEAWEILKKAFPDNKNGSRVIITTRNKDVAERVDHNPFPHALRFLRSDESWELFCEKAFKNLNPDERMENLGKEMVEKCGGLPLAIVVLGGLLSTKKPREWSRVRDHIWRNLRNNSIEISHLLDLSFDDLPSELKLCFLYLGHFPEDYEIDSEGLIRLWVAEGFIQQKGETLEESAEDILNELLNRSLLHISGGRIGVKTCRLHDLLRDLAIQKAKGFNFIRINDEANNSTQSPILPRRQAVYLEKDAYSWLEQRNQRSRSLLFFDRCSLPCELSTICVNFRFLRVLSFNECYIGEQTNLPEEIGMLIHLKCLELGNSSIRYLPPSIGNLCSLQTLVLPTSLRPGELLEIPNEICKLKSLRHLIGFFDRPLQIENLVDLQTLKSLHGQSWSTKLNTEKLVNLRELRIFIWYFTEVVFSFDSVGKLKSLRSLYVSLRGNHYFGSLQPLFHCQHLQDLFLDGRITKLPENLHELVPNLECLTLKEPYLEADPMPALEKLPNLTHLRLDLLNIPHRQDNLFCSHVKKMICSANGFPRTEILVLCAERLPEWQVEEGALQMLRRLIILSSGQITIPERLRSTAIVEQSTHGEYLYFGELWS